MGLIIATPKALTKKELKSGNVSLLSALVLIMVMIIFWSFLGDTGLFSGKPWTKISSNWAKFGKLW